MFIETPKNLDLQNFILSYKKNVNEMKILVSVAANSNITWFQKLMGLHNSQIETDI